jgi:hypothetical protein
MRGTSKIVYDPSRPTVSLRRSGQASVEQAGQPFGCGCLEQCRQVGR